MTGLAEDAAVQVAGLRMSFGAAEVLVAAFPVKALAEVLRNTYAVRPFPAWDLVNLGLWTAAGAAFAAWRFRWHS